MQFSAGIGGILPHSISSDASVVSMTTSLARLSGSGRLFFATGLVAFGILQFIYGDFVPGRAPAWPAAIPGRLIWASLSGVLLIGAGVAIISGKKARWAAAVVGTMILLWALLRHLPELAANPHGIVLTNTGKALALFGGAFAVAASLPANEGGVTGVFARIINSSDGFIYLGRFCLGIFMILAGIQHFIYTQFVATLIPAWIPGHYFWTYFAGVALIAGGAGLIIPRTVRIAAPLTGVMLFLWVLLLHIPRAVAAAGPEKRNEWTAVFEALAMSGIAFVLAGSLLKGSADRLPSVNERVE
jgi:uncharacterized membrane protein YphA (DoxX/SURF4 family)